MCFRRFLFLWRFLFLGLLHFLSSAESDSLLLLDLLHFMSSKKSDLLYDESENDGSDSGFYGTCSFLFLFDDPFGRVIVLGSGIFVPTGVKSKNDVFVFVVFVSIGVESKGG